MKKPLHIHLLLLFRVWAAGLLVLSPFVVRSQEAKDCTLPSPLLQGPVSQVLARCAIQHAQFLYAHRCTGQENCASQNAPVVSAYRTASRLYDLYLTDRDMAKKDWPVSRNQQANDAFWRGFLQERSQDYGDAERNYSWCVRLEKNSDTPDAENLSHCASGLNRLNCLARFTLALCQAQGSDDSQIVRIVTTREGGGIVASAEIDDPNDVSPPPRVQTDSSIVAVKPPTREELSQMNKAITREQMQNLQRAIDEQKLTITPSDHVYAH